VGRGDCLEPPPLFLVHDGNADRDYFALAAEASPDTPIFPIVWNVGAPFRTIEGLASCVVRAVRAVRPSGPYRLASSGFGGVVAYEITIQLLGQDADVEFLGLIDTPAPDALTYWRTQSPYRCTF